MNFEKSKTGLKKTKGNTDIEKKSTKHVIHKVSNNFYGPDNDKQYIYRNTKTSSYLMKYNNLLISSYKSIEYEEMEISTDNEVGELSEQIFNIENFNRIRSGQSNSKNTRKNTVLLHQGISKKLKNNRNEMAARNMYSNKKLFSEEIFRKKTNLKLTETEETKLNSIDDNMNNSNFVKSFANNSESDATTDNLNEIITKSDIVDNLKDNISYEDRNEKDSVEIIRRNFGSAISNPNNIFEINNSNVSSVYSSITNLTKSNLQNDNDDAKIISYEDLNEKYTFTEIRRNFGSAISNPNNIFEINNSNVSSVYSSITNLSKPNLQNDQQDTKIDISSIELNETKTDFKPLSNSNEINDNVTPNEKVLFIERYMSPFVIRDDFLSSQVFNVRLRTSNKKSFNYKKEQNVDRCETIDNNSQTDNQYGKSSKGIITDHNINSLNLLCDKNVSTNKMDIFKCPTNDNLTDEQKIDQKNILSSNYLCKFFKKTTIVSNENTIKHRSKITKNISFNENVSSFEDEKTNPAIPTQIVWQDEIVKNSYFPNEIDNLYMHNKNKAVVSANDIAKVNETDASVTKIDNTISVREDESKQASEIVKSYNKLAKGNQILENLSNRSQAGKQSNDNLETVNKNISTNIIYLRDNSKEIKSNDTLNKLEMLDSTNNNASYGEVFINSNKYIDNNNSQITNVPRMKQNDDDECIADSKITAKNKIYEEVESNMQTESIRNSDSKIENHQTSVATQTEPQKSIEINDNKELSSCIRKYSPNTTDSNESFKSLKENQQVTESQTQTSALIHITTSDTIKKLKDVTAFTDAFIEKYSVKIAETQLNTLSKKNGSKISSRSDKFIDDLETFRNYEKSTIEQGKNLSTKETQTTATGAELNVLNELIILGKQIQQLGFKSDLTLKGRQIENQPAKTMRRKSINHQIFYSPKKMQKTSIINEIVNDTKDSNYNKATLEAFESENNLNSNTKLLEVFFNKSNNLDRKLAGQQQSETRASGSENIKPEDQAEEKQNNKAKQEKPDESNEAENIKPEDQVEQKQDREAKKHIPGEPNEETKQENVDTQKINQGKNNEVVTQNNTPETNQDLETQNKNRRQSSINPSIRGSVEPKTEGSVKRPSANNRSRASVNTRAGSKAEPFRGRQSSINLPIQDSVEPKTEGSVKRLSANNRSRASVNTRAVSQAEPSRDSKASRSSKASKDIDKPNSVSPKGSKASKDIDKPNSVSSKGSKASKDNDKPNSVSSKGSKGSKASKDIGKTNSVSSKGSKASKDNAKTNSVSSKASKASKKFGKSNSVSSKGSKSNEGSKGSQVKEDNYKEDSERSCDDSLVRKIREFELKPEWKDGKLQLKCDRNHAFIVETDVINPLMKMFATCITNKAFRKVKFGCLPSAAAYIRRSFELRYGKLWHCTIGKDFDISFAHDIHTYINLNYNGISVVLYKVNVENY